MALQLTLLVKKMVSFQSRYGPALTKDERSFSKSHAYTIFHDFYENKGAWKSFREWSNVRETELDK